MYAQWPNISLSNTFTFPLFIFDAISLDLSVFLFAQVPRREVNSMSSVNIC